MTNAEANAVNVLLDWIAGRHPYEYHVSLPTDARALEMAAYLAGRADKALMAGWDPKRLRTAWPGAELAALRELAEAVRNPGVACAPPPERVRAALATVDRARGGGGS